MKRARQIKLYIQKPKSPFPPSLPPTLPYFLPRLPISTIRAAMVLLLGRGKRRS